MVERNLATAFEPDDEYVRRVDDYESDREIRWLTSFLSADKKKTYCLYEAADLDVVRRHARDLGLPADSIIEVSEFER